MKSLSMALLLLSVGTTAYFFIKEQFKSIVLSHSENILLSVCYIVTGLSIAMLIRINHNEKKKAK